MPTSHTITIGHLYPKQMNLYGDLGNVLCLKQRAEWRDIKVEVIDIEPGEKDFSKVDLYFFGGGQDRDQLSVFSDLIRLKKDRLMADLIAGIPMLSICGGYQLLGEYFLGGNGERAEGVGFLPLETVAPGTNMVHRAVGNLITEINEELVELRSHYSGLTTLVGFENHSGRTRFKKGALKAGLMPLGKVLVGQGDNEDKISDGAVYKNTICSYMHGSVLPKNPHLADYLLSKALEVKTGEKVNLQELEDSAEIAAHKAIIKRFGEGI